MARKTKYSAATRRDDINWSMSDGKLTIARVTFFLIKETKTTPDDETNDEDRYPLVTSPLGPCQQEKSPCLITLPVYNVVTTREVPFEIELDEQLTFLHMRYTFHIISILRYTEKSLLLHNITMTNKKPRVLGRIRRLSIVVFFQLHLSAEKPESAEIKKAPKIALFGFAAFEYCVVRRMNIK
ncbi:hypothetical protein H5410_044541 [Solanum commersonii]|uniref:Uncharacterized protein n=1 Tax=Solanum commersonii TaxID=4109 RepID=A0A9J5X7A2_SOLCO|nr:hypothetical protein H5410_044541 [Solanum commersonii]